MPPKVKPTGPSKKTEQKKKEKVIEVRNSIFLFFVYLLLLFTVTILGQNIRIKK